MSDDLLIVENLKKHFPIKRGIFSKTVGAVYAVDGISFSIPRGSTLSLVGESGSGKTTAGRSLLRLVEPTSGTITFDGINVCQLDRKDLRALRKRVQIIFQDPFGSLNPRMTVYSVLAEAMKAHGLGDRNSRRARCFELLELVGLPPEAADRYPHEFSGGQRQRIGIARALAVEPDLIVADEPVSALDVSVQAQILNLLKDLQERLGLTYLFIGHDLSVIRHISTTVAVMYLGRIVEIAPVEQLFNNPIHPYTKALLSAVPKNDPERNLQRTVLTGDVPSPIEPPSGCHFHPRCPDAVPDCALVGANLVEYSKGHHVACNRYVPGDTGERTPTQGTGIATNQ
ncbi:MAG: ATP-binding cassette domain-containing protein [Candidatus Hydrogenedentes bacterium]|nr:ATP-binding cassette domain-containing protein [Candidatus Hydrogenedentota bacterium]